MATNWTVVDAFEVIKKNEDRAAVADIVRRFPLASRAMILSSTNEGAEEIIRGLPSYVTVRKIENVLKGEIEEDETEAVEEKPAKKKAEKKAKKKAAKKEEPEDEEEEDEEEEEEKPKKKAKKAPAKKSKKKAEPEEDEDDDEDDDWDI